MSNEAVYAAGLLNRALDPATQPPEIQGFLCAELELLHEVIVEGMRVIDDGCGTRLLSIYSEASVPSRREWYRRLGHAVLEETREYLWTEGGFRSEHFSEARLRALVGDCTIRSLADIAFVVTF